MKARDWLPKFKENYEAASAAFKEETEKLIAERTKKSKEKYTAAAKQGALQEQRNKWRAIAYWLPELNDEAFERMLNPSANFEKSKQEGAGVPAEEKLSPKAEESLPRSSLVG